jgi:hypothetical protein
MPQHQHLLQLAYQQHDERVARADQRRAEHRTRAEVPEPRPSERRFGVTRWSGGRRVSRPAG